MKKRIYLVIIMMPFLQACGQDTLQSETTHQSDAANQNIIEVEEQQIIDTNGQILETRILPPAGFQRTFAETNSFAGYLRNLPLKPHNSEVKLYNGKTKPNYNVYDAVIDLEIGKRDLHQCADAIMRLRAEYLWTQQQYDKIHFNFTNGFRVDYSEWMKGKRIVVKDGSTYWRQSASPSNTYKDFWKYMEIIFSYAGTLSLSKELEPVNIGDIQIGDVFIQGGSPGHAIIVIDLAINEATGKKVFLLAQSYMPAQEIQILKNPNDTAIGPWYSADIGLNLKTPEWIFTNRDLKRFKD